MRRGRGRASGRRALGLELDIADSDASTRWSREVAERHGRIDVLSNNAGIEIVDGPTVADTTDEQWELVQRVNVTGIFQVCRAASPHARRRGRS